MATDVGVFMTSTGGQSWGNATNPLGLPNVQVNDIGITPGNGYIFAGPFGRGMWRMKLPTNPIGLKSLTLNPTDVIGGSTAQGTACLDIQSPPAASA